MKYINIRVQFIKGGLVKLMPIIFPDELIHADMAKVMVKHVCDQYKEGVVVTVLSAGEYRSIDGACTGGSESLKLSARTVEDERLIKGYDYFHGIEL